jgi:predicted nucleic acid-binding protein
MAILLATKHQMQFWDALVLATAAETGCRFLITEDMSSGFVWMGCQIVNPLNDQAASDLSRILTR